MSSKHRIKASRANGAPSRSPKAPEGKQRSSYNPVRPGYLADCIVSGRESRESFDELLNQFVARFAPLDDVEFGMIEEMVSSYWRLRRGWAIETQLLNESIDRQSPPSGPRGETSRLAAAFSELAARPELALLHRHETRLHRMFHRTLKSLLQLREVKPPQQSAVAPAPQNPVESKEQTTPQTPKTLDFQTNLIPITDTTRTAFPAPPKPRNQTLKHPQPGPLDDIGQIVTIK